MDSQRRQPLPEISGSASAHTTNPPSSIGHGHGQRRRKNHRGGKKKKQRRKSFALPADEITQDSVNEEGLGEAPPSFYTRPGRNFSTTSIESEALLDHREQPPFIRPRRPSVMTTSTSFPAAQPATRPRLATRVDSDEEDEGAPLLSSPVFQRSETAPGYGTGDAPRKTGPTGRRDSSMASSSKKRRLGDAYNVNYPPSVPGSPALHATDHMSMSFGDVLLRDDIDHGEHSTTKGSGDEDDERSPLGRRKTIALQAQEDVCFPQEGLSELGDDERNVRDTAYRPRPRRRRGKWPDLSILNEWSRFEKEGRSEERRAKRITEPQLIDGRLRPVHRGWFQAEEAAPYRFTYFNEEFQSTIHSQSISELVQPGGTFRELFVPDPPVLSDSSDSDEEAEPDIDLYQVLGGQGGDPLIPSRQPSLATTTHESERKHSTNSEATKADSNGHLPPGLKSPADPLKSAQNGKPPKPLRYGDRPVWWLDILSPTEAEMKVISKAFGIHPLTAEDIMMQEQREKVELFRNYYFVNYRSFDQDLASENFLEPVNMYVVVFRECVLSFHFSVTPHPANVRRRIRQLRDYLILSSDWISYAIIDDITDAFGPLIQNIEDEVDDIDYAILQMHSEEDQAMREEKRRLNEKSDSAEVKSAEAGRDMLRRVGDCRKKVMSLYRLLSNKADVIKGFAKRCNEHWEVAPRSEIGLYLGDIQDHIVTMTSNLGHYEKILARSHGNYLAQINIRMNERQEQTADVLGKLTVLGTIVLPMNIITGLWGMNVWVPGQEYEGDLNWFIAITAGLLCFGLGCYWIAKRVYRIV